MIYYTLEYEPAHFIITNKVNEDHEPKGARVGQCFMTYSPEYLNKCHFAVRDLDRDQFLKLSESRKDCEIFMEGVDEGDAERDVQVVKVMFIWGARQKS